MTTCEDNPRVVQYGQLEAGVRGGEAGMVDNPLPGGRGGVQTGGVAPAQVPLFAFLGLLQVRAEFRRDLRAPAGVRHRRSQLGP